MKQFSKHKKYGKPIKHIQEIYISTQSVKTFKRQKTKPNNVFGVFSHPHHQAEDFQNIVCFCFVELFVVFNSLIDFAEIFVYAINFDEILAPGVSSQQVSPPIASWLIRVSY